MNNSCIVIFLRLLQQARTHLHKNNKLMSIVLKSDEVNYVVYKYLLEVGLNHTAFTMFYEASLEAPAKEFRYDTQPSYLITLMERALLLTQIQSHVYLNEYQECRQPIHLLKPHTCEITQKKQDLALKIERLNDNINESIKRTNDIFSNQFRSDKYQPQPVVVEPKTDFLDNFSKVKLRKVEYRVTQRLDMANLTFCEELKTIAIKLLLEDNRIIFLQYAGGFETVAIIPTFLNDSFTKVQAVLETALYTCLCFQGNNFVVLGTDYTVRAIFQLEQPSRLVSMSENRSNPQLACFQFENSASIVNLHMFRTITKIPCQHFLWRYHNQYIIADTHVLALRTLEGETIMEFNLQEPVDFMSLSESKEYLLTVSSNTVKIWTFLKSEPLLIFEQDSKIIRSLWATSKTVNYLVILSEHYLKIWDVELSCFKREIALGQRLSEMVVVNEQNEQDSKCYLVGLAQSSLAIYDISQNRDQSIAIHSDEDTTNHPTLQDITTMFSEKTEHPHLKQLSMNESTLIANNSLYMLEASIIKDVFEVAG